MNKIGILCPLCGLTAALLQLANLIIFDDSNLASCATLKAKTPFPKQLCRSWPRQSQRKIFFDLGFSYYAFFTYSLFCYALTAYLFSSRACLFSSIYICLGHFFGHLARKFLYHNESDLSVTVYVN